MSVNINADTTNGLVLTSDTSGELKLQSAGADIATVDSSGITMASGKTLPASALTGSLPAGMGGKVLQVVQQSLTEIDIAVSVMTEIGSASITPSSTSSKILVLTNTLVHRDAPNSASNYWACRLYRGAIGGTTARYLNDAVLYQSNADGRRELNYGQALDSPATTSEVTYRLAAIRQTGSGVASFNYATNGSIILMEIAG